MRKRKLVWSHIKLVWFLLLKGRVRSLRNQSPRGQMLKGGSPECTHPWQVCVPFPHFPWEGYCTGYARHPTACLQSGLIGSQHFLNPPSLSPPVLDGSVPSRVLYTHMSPLSTLESSVSNIIGQETQLYDPLWPCTSSKIVQSARTSWVPETAGEKQGPPRASFHIL